MGSKLNGLLLKTLLLKIVKHKRSSALKWKRTLNIIKLKQLKLMERTNFKLFKWLFRMFNDSAVVKKFVQNLHIVR